MDELTDFALEFPTDPQQYDAIDQIETHLKRLAAHPRLVGQFHRDSDPTFPLTIMVRGNLYALVVSFHFAPGEAAIVIDSVHWL
jgi:hypothetical protein